MTDCAQIVLNSTSLQLVNSTVNETGSQKKLAWKLSQPVVLESERKKVPLVAPGSVTH
jgi:hypothetical protein